MKNIFKTIFLLFATVALFSSCEDIEPTVYEGNQEDQSLVGFDRGAYDLTVARDSTGRTNVQVNASAVRPVDRTFNVELLEGPGNTTADPATFSVPSSVTIPANEYIGILTIDGIDEGVDLNPEIITLELQASENDVIIEDNIVVVSVYEVCPLPENFLLGEFQIEDVEATVGPGNDSQNFQTGTVTIDEGENPTDRVFTANPLPGIAQGNQEIRLSLVCGEIIFRDLDVLGGGGCGENAPAYIYSEADNNTTYNVNNVENSYIINYTEDPNGSCGGPFQSSFRLTRVDNN